MDNITTARFCEAGPAQLCGMLLQLLRSMHLDLIHPAVEGILGKAPAPLATANSHMVGPKPSQQGMERPRCSTCWWGRHATGTRARTRQHNTLHATPAHRRQLGGQWGHAAQSDKKIIRAGMRAQGKHHSINMKGCSSCTRSSARCDFKELPC